MFEFLFKYPLSLYREGSFVFLNGWPLWMLGAGVALAAALFAFFVWRKGSLMSAGRSTAVWLLQTALAAVLLFMLWHPALSVATLKPQQNIVAVIVDDSASMAVPDEEGDISRSQSALNVLNDGLLDDLRDKFQVRVYRMTNHLDRIESTKELTADAPATHIGESLQEVVADASSLPIGAMVVLSDGADNSGGVDLETLTEIRRQNIPVHTIGFGKEVMENDIEITNMELPQRALPESRLDAVVTFHNYGYSGDKVQLTIRDNDSVLAQREITLKGDGVEQREAVLFNVGDAGVKSVHAQIAPLNEEANIRNNAITRLVNVDQRRPRILYLEGRPSWNYKFMRRGVEDDEVITLVSLVRTAENKNYAQNTDPNNPDELENGYPTDPAQLFDFDGLVFGNVEAAYLTPAQLEMIKEFVDRRGGGVLFIAGKEALADGGWKKTVVNEIMPTTLPDRPETYTWMGANAELTPEGRDSLITRIEDDPDANAKRWEELPYVRGFQLIGEPKLGAVVWADAVPMDGGGARTPLLATMNYGRGRSAILASSGTWRWQMLQDAADQSHEQFTQQLLRWLVSSTPKRVSASTPKSLLTDESLVKIRADVRDLTFLPANDATVEARILGDNVTQTIELTPLMLEQGAFGADWQAPAPGDYIVEVVARRGEEELGRDAFTVRREDGVAENFGVEQNRALLQRLSNETGGNYYTADNASDLGEDITYSEAGITVRETRDLWDMPLLFLLLLGLRTGEWLLRRKWGVI